MNGSNHSAVTSARPVARVAFYLVSILLFPLTLLGYIVYVVYLFVAGRRTPGVSITAQGPLSARWVAHHLGVREDEAANRLMDAMPGSPPFGLYLAGGPTLLAHRLTGYVPKAFRYPFEGEVPAPYEASARQTFFDRVLEQHRADVTQFVILGAGFDTRAYRLPPESQGRWFEVDTPQTQAVKRRLLDKTGIRTTGVTFVAADFEAEDWLEKLVEAGFDRSKPALFLLEGVIMYLDREAAEDTLCTIGRTASGSMVAFDYFTTEPLTSRSFYWRYGRAGTRAAGEPLKFGIDSTPPSKERLTEFLHACGLSLQDQRTLGKEGDGKRSWGGFATAAVD